MSTAMTKVDKIRKFFAAAKDPMQVTHAAAQKATGLTFHTSVFYKVKAEFRGDSAAAPKRAAPGSAAKTAQRNAGFLEYMMWVTVGLRRGWFDLYVTADTADLAKLRAAFDAAH